MVQIASIVGTAQRQNLPDSGRQSEAVASGLAMGGNPGLAGLGAGISDAGAALAQAAAAYRRDQEQLRNFQTETSFDALGTQINEVFQERTRSLSGDANGFARDFMADYDKRAGEWLQALPEGDRARWGARISQQRATVAASVLRAELGQRDAYYVNTTGEHLDLLRSGIDRSPDDLENYRRRGEEIINASGLSAQKKAEMIERWRDLADTAYAAARVRDNPDVVVGTLGGETGYARRVRAQESSGDDTAANPNSSARGRYQFTTGTWEGLVNSPEGRAAGLTLDGRTNAAQEEAAFRIFTQQNAQRLAVRGIPATEKNLYMMHFLGSGGGVDFLTRLRDGRAGDNAVEAFPRAAEANRRIFYKSDGSPRTVGEVYDLQTRRFSSAAVSLPGGDPVLERLPYERRMQIREGAEREIVQRDNAIAVEENRRTAALWNDLQRDIIDGKAGRAEIDAAREQGWLTSAPNIAQAYSMVERRERDGMLLGFANEKLANPNASWNVFDQNDKAAVNAYVAAAGGTPQVAFDVWQRTGILAAPGVAAIRGAINSNDPERVASAMQIASNMIAQRGGNVFAGIEGREQIETAAIEFRRVLNGNIVDNAIEAARHVMLFNDPDFRARAPARDKEFEDYQKNNLTVQKAADAVAEIFTRSFAGLRVPFSAPDIPAPQRAAIAQDYVELLREGYRRMGEMERAKNFAETRLKSMYGVSNGRLMKYPPEQVFMPSDDPAKPFDYIYRQAREFAQSARPGMTVDPESVTLVPLPGFRTSETWRNRQPTRYGLAFIAKDKDGYPMWDAIMPDNDRDAFMPDPEAERQRLSEERRQGMSRLRDRVQIEPPRVTAADIPPVVAGPRGERRPLSEERRQEIANERNAAAAAEVDALRRNADRLGQPRPWPQIRREMNTPRNPDGTQR